MQIFLIPILTTLILHVNGIPTTTIVPNPSKEIVTDDLVKKSNFAGQSSQIIAINLLKNKIDVDYNQVFSPLGITSLLAILAEGARDESYKEFTNSLKFPEDKQNLRDSFRLVLKNFRQDLNDLQLPSFKTWFYIYRNNTARDEYKKILREYYFVEVRDINRYLYNWDEPKTSESDKDASSESVTEVSSSSDFTSSTNSKDLLEFEALKKSQVSSSQDDKKQDNLIEKQENASKFDEVIDNKQYVEVPQIKDEILKGNRNDEQKMAEDKLKEDERKTSEQKDKEDTQRKPMPLIINQQQQQQQEVHDLKKNDVSPSLVNQKDVQYNKNEKMDNNNKQQEIKKDPNDDSNNQVLKQEKNLEQNDNEAIKHDEKLESYKKDISSKPSSIALGFGNSDNKDNIKDNSAGEKSSITSSSLSNEPEKISIPLKKLEEHEIARALESHFMRKRFSGSRSLFQKDDIASALSANSLVSRDLPTQTRMLLFNGLYYRGNWAYPFQTISKSSDDDVFYISNDKKIPVTMMKANGNYRVADCKKLNAKAIEFPYENRKYSLIVLLPNEKNGLRELINKFEMEDISRVKSLLEDQLVDIKLPRFISEQTSRSESVLKDLGLRKIFSDDRSGGNGLEDISEGLKLNVDEIVQHVILRVDDDGASQNFLSATIVGSEAQQNDVAEEGRNQSIEEKITVNRPFMYFVLDNENEFIVIAGKVVKPEFAADGW